MFSQLSISHPIHRGEGVPPGRHPRADTHPWADTPKADTPWQTPPPRQTPPGQTHTPGQTPPGQTPPGRHPPGRHSPRQTATAADDTHPTGMHSCSGFFSLRHDVIFCFSSVILSWNLRNSHFESCDHITSSGFCDFNKWNVRNRQETSTNVQESHSSLFWFWPLLTENVSTFGGNNPEQRLAP